MLCSVLTKRSIRGADVLLNIADPQFVATGPKRTRLFDSKSWSNSSGLCSRPLKPCEEIASLKDKSFGCPVTQALLGCGAAGYQSGGQVDPCGFPAHRFVIVSKDVDFQQRALLRRHPPKVVWLRLGNCSTNSVADVLRARNADILAFEADPHASFLALS